MSIPLSAEVVVPAVGSYGVQVKQQSTGLWYDFSTSLFTATPVTPNQPLALMSIAVGFVYFYDFTAPQMVAFTDDDYGMYYDNGAVTVSGVIVNVMSGTAAGKAGLNAVAADYDVAGTIGADINSAAIGGGGAPTAIQNATALLTRLLSSADFTTPLSFGELIATALPNVAPGTNGGLPTVDASNNVHGLQTTSDTAGTTTLFARVPGTVQPQTGDSFARIGVNGAGLTAVGGGDTPGTTTLLTRIPGTVQPQTGDSFARLGVNGAGLSAIPGGGADTPGTTTLLARVPGTVQPQTGDSFARIGVNGAGLSAIPGGGGDTPGTTTLLTRIPGVVQPQTGDSFARIGVNGVGLTAIEASTVLAANGLDNIMMTSGINMAQGVALLLATWTKLDESVAGITKFYDADGFLRLSIDRTNPALRVSTFTPPSI